MRLIVELLTSLEAEGYPLGPGKLVQLETLMRQLPPDLPPAALRTQLAPLFAGSPEEQRRFYELFDGLLQRYGQAADTGAAATGEPLGSGRENARRQALWQAEARWRRLFLGTLLALCALSGAMFEAEAPLTWALLAAALAATGYAGWKMPPSHRSRLGYWAAAALLAAAGYVLKSAVVRQKTPPPPVTLRTERFGVEQGRTVERPLAAPADTARLLGTAMLSPASGTTPTGGRAELAAATLRYTAPHEAPPGATDSIRIALRYADRRDTLLLVADIFAAPAPKPEKQADTIAEIPLPFPRDLRTIEIDPDQQTLADLYRRWQWPLKALLFLLIAVAAWAYARWDQRRRERLVAEIEQRDRPPYIWRIETGEEQRLDFADNLSLLLNRLRRREGADAHRLDVRATVRATARRGGRATFVFREQTRPPEYLLLIDRYGDNDHLARLFDSLYAELRRAEVPVERFFYHGDPRACFSEAHPEGLPLGELLHRHRDARLLLVGEGQRLLVPSSGALAPWTALFEGWRRRALLLPKPTRTWGRREQALAELFAIVPASVEGLDLALEQFETLEQRSPAETLRRVADAVAEPFEFEGSLPASLSRHFPEPLVRWIAACAVYPALHWDLTLYLGRALSPPDAPSLLNAANLRQLARLPWFVQGRIPDNARLQLVEHLAQLGLETTVRQAIDRLLRQAPAPPQGSAAWDEHRMNVVLNELLLRPDPARRRALEREFERYLAAGKQPDFVTFKRLERQPTALDLLAPESWKKHLFRHGSSRFGWRQLARLLPTLRLQPSAAALEAAAWQRATAANTPEAYGEYLANHPDGPNAAEARSRLKPAPPGHNPIPLPDMVEVKAGTYTRGCTGEQGSDCYDDEKPPHRVTLTKDFYLARTEVTNAQYAAFLNEKGNQVEDGAVWINLEGRYSDAVRCRIRRGADGRFTVEKGYEEHPVIYVSWYGARAYCDWLSEKTKRRYRLPTEAEWEYAARGGHRAPAKQTKYAGSDIPDEVAWYAANSQGQPQAVGRKKANALGLYDMSGNVWEWCSDYWGNYSSGPQTDPVGPSGGRSRVVRGGSWDYYFTRDVRVSYRDFDNPYVRVIIVGFRAAQDK